jgi:hypothetical protein
MPFNSHDAWSATVVVGMLALVVLAVPIALLFDGFTAGLLLIGFGCMVLLGLLSAEPPVKRWKGETKQ